ncbi:hypothetical protein, partial [Crocosphaera sp. Alani8]|uniref:hypothetical protein n=1 Tax=Crocosphaera sp. Alani8 TaxID=3038952 RepID=UPI00313E4364
QKWITFNHTMKHFCKRSNASQDLLAKNLPFSLTVALAGVMNNVIEYTQIIRNNKPFIGCFILLLLAI